MNQQKKNQVVVIGATGLIGTQVTSLFSSGQRAERYEVLGLTHETQPSLNLEDPRTIAAFFAEDRAIDHVIVTAGNAHFGPAETLTPRDFEIGLKSKLMGQVNIALAALRRVRPSGSVTLTSGQLSHHPIPGSAAVALVNGAIDSFVRAVALDVPSGPRINVVSPGWIKETMVRMGLDPTPGTSARDVASLYVRAVEGNMSGEVIEDRG